MRTLFYSLFTVLALVGVVTLSFTPASAAKTDKAYEACSANPKSPVCANPTNDEVSKVIQTVVNTLLFVLSAIAVIMIIVGGIRYTTSNGDSSQLTGAKNTILYSVVGLVVAILAFAIVNFVVGMF